MNIPVTAEQIERRGEALMNRLDRLYLSSALAADDYEAEVKRLVDTIGDMYARRSWIL